MRTISTCLSRTSFLTLFGNDGRDCTVLNTILLESCVLEWGRRDNPVRPDRAGNRDLLVLLANRTNFLLERGSHTANRTVGGGCQGIFIVVTGSTCRGPASVLRARTLGDEGPGPRCHAADRRYTAIIPTTAAGNDGVGCNASISGLDYPSLVLSEFSWIDGLPVGILGGHGLLNGRRIKSRGGRPGSIIRQGSVDRHVYLFLGWFVCTRRCRHCC
mmetsp:Transcript_2982/g.6458  ORF Transcript_2982/g.6458 Transcript_2982/m.6458 type:complete len:216 (+) Transcript_2982:2779-3426(+)